MGVNILFSLLNSYFGTLGIVTDEQHEKKVADEEYAEYKLIKAKIQKKSEKVFNVEYCCLNWIYMIFLVFG